MGEKHIQYKQERRTLTKYNLSLYQKKMTLNIWNKKCAVSFSLCRVTDGGKSRARGRWGRWQMGATEQKRNVRSERLMWFLFGILKKRSSLSLHQNIMFKAENSHELCLTSSPALFYSFPLVNNLKSVKTVREEKVAVTNVLEHSGGTQTHSVLVITKSAT